MTSANGGNAREGARLAFGQVVNVVPSYVQAKVILALDSDFLGTESGMVRAIRGIAEGRKLKTKAAKIPGCIMSATQCSVPELMSLTQQVQSFRKRLTA